MALDPIKRLQAVIDRLTELQGKRFYGKLLVEFLNGTIVRMVQEESIKLEEDYVTKRHPEAPQE